MLDCFIDYIGFTNCGGAYDTVPESGQYINSLPGITLENVDSLADREQRTYQGVWDDVQKEATNRFYTDVISEVSKCFSLNKDCDYGTLICTNQELLTNAWKYLLGSQLMIERLYSDRLNRFTTVDREQAKELKDFFQVEYESYLKQAVQLFDLTDCELCCGSNPQTVYWLP